MLTAYHPQTDGQTECVNQALEQYLRCYVDYNFSNWLDLLPSAEFAYNNQAHEGIKESLFYLEYSRYPRAGPILVKESPQRDLNDLTYKIQEALEQAKAALTLTAERMKWYYDKKVQSVPFKIGDKVLLNLKNYQTMEQALRPWYKGPFEIIEKLSLVTFWLRMPPVRATGVELQEIPQLIIIYEIWLQPTSRRFLRELDEASEGNNLHYILQCLCIPASVTRV